jgi:hypothetical protein
MSARALGFCGSGLARDLFAFRHGSVRLVVALGLLLLASIAFADVKKDYQDGVAAANKGNWAEVKRLMRAALAADPAPKARMRVAGVEFIPYVPHYYLGLANAKLGDCDAAISAFKTPASQAVVSGLSAIAAEQGKQLANCEQTLLAANDTKPVEPVNPPVSTAAITPPVTPPVSTAALTTPKEPVKPPVTPAVAALAPARLAPATAALAKLDKQIVAIEGALRAAPMAGTGDARGLNTVLAKLRQQRQQIGDQLERARSTGDGALLTGVVNQAGALQTSLTTLDERVQAASKGLALQLEDRLREQAKTRSTAAVAKLDQSLLSAKNAGVEASAAATGVAAAKQALQQAVAGNDRAVIERALTAAANAGTQLDKAIAAAPKLAPDALRSLVTLYLAADYAKVAVWDQLAMLPDERSRAQALLVRAAARLHLYVRGGEQNGNLNASVDSDLRDAKRLDRALKPNAQAFSPKLVARFAAL